MKTIAAPSLFQPQNKAPRSSPYPPQRNKIQEQRRSKMTLNSNTGGKYVSNHSDLGRNPQVIYRAESEAKDLA